MVRQLDHVDDLHGSLLAVVAVMNFTEMEAKVIYALQIYRGLSKGNSGSRGNQQRTMGRFVVAHAGDLQWDV